MGEEAVFGVGVLFVLLFSTFAETLGFHFIIGAFFGGVLLNKDIIGTNFFHSLSHTLESITSHFFTPIFFAYLGLLVQLDAFQDGMFIAIILGVGYITMISAELRPELCRYLIVADLGLAKGHINSDIFSVLILFGILSVILNPMLYRRFFRYKEDSS